MDNSGSINDYHDLFQSQILTIFQMAKSAEDPVSITLIPIGKNYFQTVHENDVGDIFKFGDKTTYISSILQKADPIINKQKDTILFISDMEPDHTNTNGSWELLAEDYKDVLDYYKILYQWVKTGVNIYFILLNHESMAYRDNKLYYQKDILEEINKIIVPQQKAQELFELIKNDSIGDSTDQYPQFILSKQQNKILIQKILRSLSSASNGALCYYYPLPLDRQSIFYSIVEPIINPNVRVVNKLKILIEIPEYLVNLKNKYPYDFTEELTGYLPKKVGKNPTRYLDYHLINCNDRTGSRKTIKHNKDFDYHFHVFWSGFGNSAKIYQTYFQGKKRIVDNDTSRDLNSFKYSSEKDIFSRLEEYTKKLEDYHEIDFPIPEKDILIKIINKERPEQKLAGYSLNVGEKISLPTYENGICATKVRRQTNVEVSLRYKSSLISNTEKILPLTKISKNIIANNEKEKPIIINIPQKCFQDVAIIIDKIIDSNVEVIISQADNCKFQKILTFTMQHSARSTHISLLPGSYYCNLNYNNDKYLNKWFSSFIVSRDDSDVEITTKEDQFYEKTSAIKLINSEIEKTKNWAGNALNVSFQEHLLGSRNSLLRIFQHLDYNEQLIEDKTKKEKTKKDIILMKTFWKRIYTFLFEGNEHVVDTCLYHSFISLGLTDDERNELMPAKGAKKYVKRMMEDFTGTTSNIQFEEKEKKYYHSIKSKLKLKHLDAIIHFFNFEK